MLPRKRSLCSSKGCKVQRVGKITDNPIFYAIYLALRPLFKEAMRIGARAFLLPYRTARSFHHRQNKEMHCLKAIMPMRYKFQCLHVSSLFATLNPTISTQCSFPTSSRCSALTMTPNFSYVVLATALRVITLVKLEFPWINICTLWCYVSSFARQLRLK